MKLSKVVSTLSETVRTRNGREFWRQNLTDEDEEGAEVDAEEDAAGRRRGH